MTDSRVKTECVMDSKMAVWTGNHEIHKLCVHIFVLFIYIYIIFYIYIY